VICFENDRMVEVSAANAPLAEALGSAAGTLSLTVRSVAQMLGLPAVMPVGLDELLQIFEGADARAHFGYGVSEGPDRAREAVEDALRSPLLEEGRLLSEPGRILLHLTGDDSLSLAELQAALRHLSPHLGPATQVHVGVATDHAADGRLGVALLACTRSGLPVAVPDDEEDFPVALAPAPAEAVPEEEKPAKGSGKKGKVGKKSETEQTQEELPLDQAMRGRFKDLDPTMVDGQDLDIPTFIRMRIRLK
jgi:cell division protein FtsZ